MKQRWIAIACRCQISCGARVGARFGAADADIKCGRHITERLRVVVLLVPSRLCQDGFRLLKARGS